MTDSRTYRLRVENRTLADWRELCETHPDEMAAIKAFLHTQPTNTRITNGKVKKLKGRLQGILQIDVTYNERIRYEVDKNARTVTILYAGDHP